MNIANNLSNMARFFPDHTAIIYNGRNITYRQLDDESSRFASSLCKMGISSGDNVAIFLKNSYEWVMCYYGCIKSGAVAVAIPATIGSNELNLIIDDCRPKAIITDAAGAAKIGSNKGKSHLLIGSELETKISSLIEQGNSGLKNKDLDRHDPAAILYTGGTTGFPKGVILTHQNIQTSCNNVAYNERTSNSDVSLCFLPLNHVFAQVHIMGSAIYAGATVVIQESFDLDLVLDAIRLYGITKFYGVPTIYVRLLGLNDLEDKIRTLRYTFSAAASMAEDVAREWKRRTGLDIHEAYGMTESASMVTFNHYIRHVVGSVGTPANLVEVAILAEDGLTKDPGKEGEICISGPNIMKGYLNRPKETSDAFVGTWFRSGDVGYLNEDGYLFIVDRIKDLIITGGENVYPKEVENALYGEPEIEEVVVVGIPDREYGEKVVAMVVLRKGRQMDPIDLRARLKSKLSPFKVPKEFIVVDSIPRTSAGKVLKREIRDLILNKYKNLKED